MKKFKDMSPRQKVYGATAVAVGVTMLLPDFANAGKSMLPSFIADDIADAYGIDEALALSIAQTADDLDIDPYALANVINHESGFNPAAKNPNSSASGLIQFMEKTARRLGTTTAHIRSLGALDQMQYVRAYFEPFGPLRSKHSVAMAVFYPRAINWPSFRPFPLRVIRANKVFTPGGYLRRMSRHAKLPAVIPR